MKSISPVLTSEWIESEKVIALEQKEYFPIITLQVSYPDGIGTLTRFEFSDAERAAIAKGADLLLSQPHHGPMMPIGLQLAFRNEHPLEGID